MTQGVTDLSEKEKYAKRMEADMEVHLNLGAGDPRQVHGLQHQPLGKYSSQKEMNDPEARRRLKEVLDQQVRDKRASGGATKKQQQISGANRKIRGLKKPPMAAN